MKRDLVKPLLARGQEQIARDVCRILTAGFAISIPIAFLTPGNDDLVTIAFYTPILGLLAGTFVLLNRGKLRAAGFVLTALFFGISSVATILFGGVSYAITGSFFLCAMVAASILGTRASVVTAILASVFIGVAAILQGSGLLPEPQADPNAPGNAAVATILPLLLAIGILRSMLKSRDSILQAAAEREAERDRAQAELVQAQKLDVVGRVAGGIAHDFNNLLTVIRATAEVIRLDGPSDDLLDDIDDSTARATMLTRRLLAFARPSDPEVEEIHLRSAIQDFEPLLSTIAGDGVALDLDLDECTVMLDEMSLQQILLNLVINAREAIDGRGTVTITLERDGDEAVLGVADTGPGVAPEVRDRIFDPFFTTKSSGTGLGLSTIKRIVEQSGGRLALRQADEGAAFEIRWPCHGNCRAQRRRPNRRTLMTPADFRPRVLVIDDNAPVRKSVVSLLRSRGWQVDEAGDGLEGLAKVEADAPNLVITDNSMPGMTGTELLSTLREDGSMLPVLVVSGQPIDDLDAPHAVFLPKPFEAAQLFEAVYGLLQSADRG